MTLKTLIAALALAAISLPAATAVAAGPAPAKPAVMKGHKKSCYDSAWGSQEFKDCEAKFGPADQKH